MKDFVGFFKKVWHDPVWSKVIASGIIAGLGYLFVQVVATIERVNIFKAILMIGDFLIAKSSIYNIVLFIVIIILAFLLFHLRSVRKHLNIPQNKIPDKNKLPDPKETPDILPNIGIITTGFFEGRICDAFPSTRGLLIIDKPKMIHDRFDIFFRKPIIFSPNSDPLRNDPIWLFRDSTSIHIDSYVRLSRTKCLLEFDEIRLSMVAVYHSQAYYKSFIYCETFPEKPVNVEKFTKERINAQVTDRGYCIQEYGLFNKMPITSEEYSDGSAIRRGKVIKLPNAEIRVRHLSRYNFILAAPDSPINSIKFEEASGPLLNGILRNTNTVQEIVELVESLHKRET